jgi:hypothetical protein
MRHWVDGGTSGGNSIETKGKKLLSMSLCALCSVVSASTNIPLTR